MVKDFKYIIKRILIGVGIALVLMFLKGGLVLQAHAKTYNIIPNELRLTYTNTNSNTNTATYSTLNELTDSNYPYNTFYGRDNINANYFVHQQLYRLETTNKMKSGFYDIHYISYSDVSFQEVDHLLQPFSFNLRNNGRVFTCTNDNGGGQGTTQTVPINNLLIGVSCTNVYLDLDNVNVVYAMIEQSGTKTLIGTAYGISAVNFQWSALNSMVDVQSSIDANTQAQQETNDTLKDESSPNTGGLFENNDTGSLSNSPVSDLITMPISLLQAVNNNASSSCTTWNLGSLLGTNLNMPCINLQQTLGSYLYNLIDMAICLFLAYNIGLLCITIYNNVISLKDDFDDMYQPKHSYRGAHEEGSAFD